MDALVRRLTPEDAKNALAVHHAAVHVTAAQDYSVDILDQWARLPVTDRAVSGFIENPENEIRLVAEFAGQVVGFAAIVIAKSELRACYVAPDMGGKGIGRALVSELERIAVQEGLTSLWLDASVTACPFYQALGYETEKHGEHVLGSGQRMACVHMQKAFTP